MNKTFTRLACILLVLIGAMNMGFAQTSSISGIVTDKLTNETLPGVAIKVKGKTIGTSTKKALDIACARILGRMIKKGVFEK